jgi:hypothetical protein
MPLQYWLRWPQCRHGHGMMLPKRWRWMERSRLIFEIIYWLGIAYFLVMAFAFSWAAVTTQNWFFIACAILTIAFFPLSWYLEVFRCSACGEQCSRRELLRQGESHGA